MKIRYSIVISAVMMLPWVVQAQWQTLAPMPTPRWGACAAELDGWIYVIGGKNGTGYFKTVERFNPEKNLWETGLAELKESRAGAACVVYEGKIFVLGGENDHEILDKVEFYDPRLQKWEEFEELKTGRNAAGAAVFQNRLSVFGGNDEKGNYLNQTEYYDSVNGKWQTWQELTLPLNRSSMGVQVKNDTLYLIGGFYYGPIGTIDRYTASGGWETVASLAHPRGNLATAIIGDSLFAIGGLGFDQPELTMEIWSLSTYEKLTEQTMTAARFGMASAVSGKIIFLFGGDLTNPPSDQPLNLVEQFGFMATAVSANDRQIGQPGNYVLAGNYPNPMRDQTRFWIQSAKTWQHEPVHLIVYDLLGKVVWRHEDIFSGYKKSVLWDGLNLNGQKVTPGIYFYKINLANRVLTEKIIITH